MNQLAKLLEMEIYYRENSRRDWLRRNPGLLARLLVWKRLPRDGYFQFEDNPAW